MSLDFELEEDIACPKCNSLLGRNVLFSANITHNLATMAEVAGLYEWLWMAQENCVLCAQEIVPFLRAGLRDLKKRPDFFRGFNSANGYGTYDTFVSFVERVLNACVQYPKAHVIVDK